MQQAVLWFTMKGGSDLPMPVSFKETALAAAASWYRRYNGGGGFRGQAQYVTLQQDNRQTDPAIPAGSRRDMTVESVIKHHSINQFLQSHKIAVLEWPTNSPDLNPIEQF